MLLFTIRYIMSEWSDGIYIHDYNYEKKYNHNYGKNKKNDNRGSCPQSQ